MHRSGTRLGLALTLQAWAWLFVVFASVSIAPASAQEKPSAEELRAIEFGKEIFKNKAQCQYCHKWDGGGDQGYGGLALSLRKTQLTPEQMSEVIRCGRPTTGMPYHEKFAYTDKRCYGMDEAELGSRTPTLPPGSTLQRREVEALADYLLAKVVGRGAVTKEECEEVFGASARSCAGGRP